MKKLVSGFLLFVAVSAIRADDKKEKAKEEKPLSLATIADFELKHEIEKPSVTAKNNDFITDKWQKDFFNEKDSWNGKRAEGEAQVASVEFSSDGQGGKHPRVAIAVIAKRQLHLMAEAKNSDDPILMKLKSGDRVKVYGTIICGPANIRVSRDDEHELSLKDCTFEFLKEKRKK